MLITNPSRTTKKQEEMGEEGGMKFCERYEEYYMRGLQGKGKNELPGIGFRKLKKILNMCSKTFECQNNDQEGDGAVNLQPNTTCSCFHHCPDCDGTFFPTLLKEISGIVGCFNQHAKKLLQLHFAPGYMKLQMWLKSKLQGNHHVALIQKVQDLVTYAMINSIAIRKLLMKYDKIHCSNQGQAFRSQAQRMHIEILQSPWLYELIAFHINWRQTTTKKTSQNSSSSTDHHPIITGFSEDCWVSFDDGKPSLSFALSDSSVKLDIDLTCSICLDTLFDPVSLRCSHIFCYMCACSAASVSFVDGLKVARREAKCPLCREESVYEGAVHLDELNILLRESCPEYWKDRAKSERVERVRQVKEYWESHTRAVMGI